ncbi:MAG: hypothetical protein IJ635_08980 [Bacteroidaceae bacterium]|nr:hypothetical protein [Bacteroidaceae bacterium]
MKDHRQEVEQQRNPCNEQQQHKTPKGRKTTGRRWSGSETPAMNNNSAKP